LFYLSIAGSIFTIFAYMFFPIEDGDTTKEEKGGGGDITKGSENRASIAKTASAAANKSDYGSGGVLNLMQSDVAIIEMLTLQLHTLWDGILQTSIYVALLYKYLGPPVLYGVMVLLTTIPINAITLRLLNRLNRKETLSKDARMRKTTESLVNMSLLKLQGWESTFARGIQDHRAEELMRLRRRGSVRALNQAISNAVPTITLVVTLSAYAKTGKPILASTIFTAISLFNQLRFPLLFYPMLIDSMANGRNSLRRISNYLTMEEILPYVERRDRLIDGGGGGSIEMRNGSFLWSRTGGKKSGGVEERGEPGGVPALCDASFTVGPGEIVAVVGDVGSGKSALVKSLIGELHPVPDVRGSAEMIPRVIAHGSMAYCAQEAWLPKGSIRESVVFGRAYDEARYLDAIFIAGLDDDMSSSGRGRAKGMLTHETDVGEDGLNLSGGQRARVALARALYEENAGVYILDDPLSALDATVSSIVFERVSERLRREKAATVFVTNDPNLPRRCDKVILMGSSESSSCSRVIDVGTYDELISRGHDLTVVLPKEEIIDYDEDDERIFGVNESHDDPVVHSLSSIYNDTISNCHADPDCKNALQQDPALLAEHVVPQPIEPSQESVKLSANQRQLSTDDSMSTGAVRLSTYTSYLKSVRSPLLIAGAIASYLISNGSQFFQQLIIARWTDAGKGGAMAAAVNAKHLNQLIGAAVMVSVSMYYRSYLTMRVGVRASNDIHKEMLKSVFQAPLSFFSATPSGQLLTRFGKELDVVDRSLPDGISSVLYCSLQIFFSIVALAGVVSPLLAIPIGTVGIFYVKAMGKFRPAARDLKRCESKSRSPIYTHFREALRGAETIRSVPSGQSMWSNKHRKLTDENISVFYSVKALDRWLSVRLESLGNAVVFTAAIGSVFLTRAGKLKSGAAGWGLTQALSITGLLTVCFLLGCLFFLIVA
jgi:ABC-type multidrug transport system fused ATPase/permease subunit